MNGCSGSRFARACALLVSLAVPAGAAADSPVTICVPTAANTAIKTPAAGGSCAAGTTAAPLARQADLDAAKTRIAELETLLAGVTRTASALRISGTNLQLVDGSGKTDSKTGKGNLIVGYNETPGAQTGSHNVIVGDSHTATSYASLIAGNKNQSKAPYQLLGGYNNISSGQYASIPGGYANTVTSTYGSIVGGGGNLASAYAATIAGGCGNVAGTGTSAKESTCAPEGRFQSVSGGTFNKARASSASISGGCGNEVGTVQPAETQCETLPGTRFQWMGGGIANLIEANSIGTAAVGGQLNRVGTSGVEGDYAAAVGGNRNRATGTSSVALGGYDNAASYSLTTTTGGRGNDVVGYNGSSVGGLDNAVVGGYGASFGGRRNVAADGYAATLGGCANLAGDYTAPSPSDCPTTGTQVVVGGQENVAKGRAGVIAGGRFNEAVAAHNFGGAFGGCRNTVGSVKSVTFTCEDYPSSFGVTVGGEENSVAATSRSAGTFAGFNNAILSNTFASGILGNSSVFYSQSFSSIPAP